MQAQPPEMPPPGWGVASGFPPAPATPPRDLRRGLWIPLAAVIAVVLVAAAVFGGYALGRARATAQQPASHTASAAFVHFRLARGWNVLDASPTGILLQSGSDVFGSVRLGRSGQDHVTSDADVFRNELYATSQAAPRRSVGSCLRLTRVTIGGKAGEEVGFLFRSTGSPGDESCTLVWADVQGSKYYLWSSQGPVAGLSQRVSATQAMQRTAVWTR